MADRSLALKLRYETGTYLCTWTVPSHDGVLVELPGEIEVNPGRQPVGSVYGTVPLKSEPAGVTAFPQRIAAPVLFGTMANGGRLLLIDAEVTYWIAGQGRIAGGAALLGGGSTWFGLSSPKQFAEAVGNDAPLIAAAEFQVDGLDALLGVAPISHYLFPYDTPDGSPQTWSAQLDRDARGEWAGEGASLAVSYIGRVQGPDGYRFSMEHAPVARLTLDEPTTLRHVVDDYVEPLRRIASVAIGKPQDLTYLAVAPAFDPARKATFQVYGTGITQVPYESSGDVLRASPSVILARPDNVSLLALVQQWRRLTDDHHPLVETYGSMLHTGDQHPRSRFLLLVQALEGLHGFETRETYQSRCETHAQRRADVLARAKVRLQRADAKFLKNHLQRRPPTSLQTVVRDTLRAVPGALMDALAGDALVGSVVASGAADSPGDAVRVIRNELAHGTRGYDTEGLNDLGDILERAVRAHVLRILGCPPVALARVAQP